MLHIYQSRIKSVKQSVSAKVSGDNLNCIRINTQNHLPTLFQGVVDDFVIIKNGITTTPWRVIVFDHTIELYCHENFSISDNVLIYFTNSGWIDLPNFSTKLKISYLPAFTFANSPEQTVIRKTGRYIAFPSAVSIGSKIVMVFKDGISNAGSGDTYVMISNDNGNTWGEPRLIHTRIGGRHWQNAWISRVANRLIVSMLSHDGLAENGLNKQSYIFYSDDYGETWSAPHHVVSNITTYVTTPHSKIMLDDSGGMFIACHAKTAAGLYTIINLMRSVDGGVTWQDYNITTLSSGISVESAIIYDNNSRLLITARTNHIHSSVDFGRNISFMHSNQPWYANAVYVKHNKAIYLIGRLDNNIFTMHKSIDNGATWSHEGVIDDYVAKGANHDDGGYADMVYCTDGLPLMLYYTYASNGDRFIAMKKATPLLT